MRNSKLKCTKSRFLLPHFVLTEWCDRQKGDFYRYYAIIASMKVMAAWHIIGEAFFDNPAINYSAHPEYAASRQCESSFICTCLNYEQVI